MQQAASSSQVAGWTAARDKIAPSVRAAGPKRDIAAPPIIRAIGGAPVELCEQVVSPLKYEMILPRFAHRLNMASGCLSRA